MRSALPKNVDVKKSFEKFASYNPSPLSLEKLVIFGSDNANQTASFEFLRKELPVRLANIMKEINLLPTKLLGTPSVGLVQNWYQQSFREILSFENVEQDTDILDNFTETLTTIRNRHVTVVETMAQGMLEMKSKEHVSYNMENQIHYFLDRFYMMRISIRMLINQHTLLFGSQVNNDHRNIGCIDPNCDVVDVAKDAYENARFLCEQYYLVSPELEITSHNPSEDNSNVIMVYVPSHLYHMLFELFKNGMRATVEHHADKIRVPKMKLMISKGAEDITIQVSDEGGGIPRSVRKRLFEYMYSTAPQPQRGEADHAPLAGYGYGLPLSRLYARYFHGDIDINSVEGYGTNALIYMKVFPSDANELLPIYNKTSSKVYETSLPVSAWSSPTPHPKPPQS